MSPQSHFHEALPAQYEIYNIPFVTPLIHEKQFDVNPIAIWAFLAGQIGGFSPSLSLESC